MATTFLLLHSLRTFTLSDSAHGYGPELELGFGINLYFPFHRVGTHLEDLIVLTIYVGFIHIIFGKLIGFGMFCFTEPIMDMWD